MMVQDLRRAAWPLKALAALWPVTPALVAAAWVMAARAEVPRLMEPMAASASAVVDVYFPPRQQAKLEALVTAQVTPGSAQYHHWLTPAQFASQFGPSPASVAAVTAALRAEGFTVTDRSALGLRFAGSVGAVERSFRATIARARFADGSERLVASPRLRLPAALVTAGAVIPQFSTVAARHRHMHRLAAPPSVAGATGPYLAADLRQAYDYPSVQALNGKGATIGVLMTGDFRQIDMDDYFADELLPAALQPTITSVPIDGGTRFDADNSVETHLDIQQSAGMAPGANVVLYNLVDLSDAAIMAGLTRIMTDNVVDVVNMSFGGAESQYLAANNSGVDHTDLLQQLHALFLQGNALGITFVASSGDHGGDPTAPTCVAQVCVARTTITPENPADDPNVTGVGGTNLVTGFTAGSNASPYVRENANFDLDADSQGIRWASGGGSSAVFAKPSYQTLVATPSGNHRMVPDLSLHMGGCPSDAITPCGADRSSDWVWIMGQREGVIGTSASSPDIAGLFALKRKLTGSRLGNENLDIYTVARQQGLGKVKAFRHTGIPGSNGPYKVGGVYDRVIGNGTVIARGFLGAASLAPSGVPGTASNP